MKRIIFNFIFLISIIPSYARIIETGKMQEGGVKGITVSQLHQLLNNIDFILVNVHIPYAGEIPQTDLQIPYNKISNHLVELPAKDKKIVLYCRSDRMSTIASETLAKEGYSNLFNLIGGMNAWEAAGYRLIDNQPSMSSEKLVSDENVFVTLRDSGKVMSLNSKVLKTGPAMTYITQSKHGNLILATSSKENKVYLIGTAQNKIITSIETGKTPKGVKFSPNGETALVANEGSNSVSVIDVDQQKVINEIAMPEMPHNIIFSPSGEKAYVTIQGGAMIAAIDMEKQMLEFTIPVEGKPHNLDISPDGKRLFTANLETNDIAVIDLTNRIVIKRIKVSEGHHGIDVTPDGSRIYVSGIGSNLVNIIDPKKMELIEQIEVGKGPHGLRTSSDGSRLFVAVTGENQVVEIDTESFEIIQRIPAEGLPFWLAVMDNP